jgi:cob(I)alamin adenosyltransferase
MKLYTRSGDDGTTGLFGGGRVSKTHPRVGAYGTVDELNAHLGVVAAHCRTDDAVDMEIHGIVTAIQSRLFDLGADLATPPESPHADKIARIEETHVAEAEGWIDTMEAGNEPMQNFVLPGGTALAAHLHVARTVCRRAERGIVALAAMTPVGSPSIQYLNRIGDLLFAMARRANRAAGVPDVPWHPSGTTAAD